MAEDSILLTHIAMKLSFLSQKVLDSVEVVLLVLELVSMVCM